MPASITDTDKGYGELVRRLYGLAGRKLTIEVGILAADGDKAYPSEAAFRAAMTVLEVASIVHFGTEDGRIPARRFISGWFDGAEKKLRQDFATLMQSVVAGRRTSDEILELMGQRCVGEIQAYIARHGDGDYPENAPSTIARKGSSTPLIDTGIMRGSVSYRVNGGEG